MNNMSLAFEELTPSPHLLPNRSSTWPRSHTYAYPLGSSPPSGSPQPVRPFVSHMPDSPISTQDINDLPTPAWYGPPVSGPNAYHNLSNIREVPHDILGQTSYAPFHHFVPPHTPSIVPSQPASTFHSTGEVPLPTPQHDLSRAISPSSAYSHKCDSTRASEEPQLYPHSKTVAHFENQKHSRDLSESRVNMPQPVVSWALEPLSINNPAIQSDPYQPTYPAFFQNPFMSNSVGKVPSNHLVSPQPRRVFTPIAPQIAETSHQLGVKRQRDEDDAMQESKRRRRSDSNTPAPPELSDEDKLLLKLKDEDSIPWKDIAARFQTDMGKTYQIPALQMRLKRLRERMRVWNEADVKALRMAHDFWIQNKFDIISQKMLDFGAQERWTARQCARKWAEVESLQRPPVYHDQRLPPGFAPSSMSPDEPPHQFLPYQHVQ